MIWLASLLVLLTALVACGGGSSYTPAIPTSPSSPSPPPLPPPSSPPIVSGKVLNEPGICIDGATVEVVRGQRLGDKITQTTPCDAWSYGSDEGFEFTDLTPGVDMTLRASAPGFAAREMTVRPPNRQADIVLSESQ